MRGLLRHFELVAQSKTGLSAGIAAWALVAALAAVGTLCWLSVTAFLWLAQHYDSITAALILTFFYLLVSLIALLAAVLLRRHTVAQANLALAERQNTLLDPRLLAIGMEIGRTIGWRRIASVAAAGVLAAGIAKELSALQRKSDGGNGAAAE